MPPDIAIRTRLKYKEQKTGEWLRFATPLKSMIDRDGVPHLPKLGKALGKYFIETYWSYPKAIFFPHNEFVVAKKSETKKKLKLIKLFLTTGLLYLQCVNILLKWML